MRRFPPPWTVEAIEAGFKVLDANGQALAYVYGYADPRDAGIAKALTLDEARRIAANIAKLPNYLAANPESTD
jgi:2-methylisocitrate lyase-like PEP mutase family enzyme